MEKQETGIAALLSERDVAQITKVSPTTLWRLRRDGGGPKFIRIASKIRYRAEDVKAWINSRPGGGE